MRLKSWKLKGTKDWNEGTCTKILLWSLLYLLILFLISTWSISWRVSSSLLLNILCRYSITLIFSSLISYFWCSSSFILIILVGLKVTPPWIIRYWKPISIFFMYPKAYVSRASVILELYIDICAFDCIYYRSMSYFESVSFRQLSRIAR